MKWLWIAAAGLFAVAAGALWFRLGDPTFIVGLASASVAALGRAVWPFIKRLLDAKGSEEQRRKLREGDTSKEGGR